MKVVGRGRCGHIDKRWVFPSPGIFLLFHRMGCMEKNDLKIQIDVCGRREVILKVVQFSLPLAFHKGTVQCH